MLSHGVRYLGEATTLVARIVIFLLFARFFIVEPGMVSGQSMEPNLHDNELLFVDKISSVFSKLSRFDMVQLFFPYQKDKLLVKRVIGLPGETIIFKDDTIYIRDKKGDEFQLLESYLGPGVKTKVPKGKPWQIEVPPYSYFVLGDNRSHSVDSRYFGSVHRRNIIGKIVELR
jgi:signal peptidase I